MTILPRIDCDLALRLWRPSYSEALQTGKITTNGGDDERYCTIVVQYKDATSKFTPTPAHPPKSNNWVINLHTISLPVRMSTFENRERGLIMIRWVNGISKSRNLKVLYDQHSSSDTEAGWPVRCRYPRIVSLEAAVKYKRTSKQKVLVR